jgi:UDP:flavonoid glycosyltransferase YjiC (YdhE family)
MKISKLKKDTLEGLVLDLFNNPLYKAKAEEVQQQMAGEDYTGELLEILTR